MKIVWIFLLLLITATGHTTTYEDDDVVAVAAPLVIERLSGARIICTYQYGNREGVMIVKIPKRCPYRRVLLIRRKDCKKDDKHCPLDILDEAYRFNDRYEYHDE